MIAHKNVSTSAVVDVTSSNDNITKRTRHNTSQTHYKHINAMKITYQHYSI